MIKYILYWSHFKDIIKIFLKMLILLKLYIYIYIYIYIKSYMYLEGNLLHVSKADGGLALFYKTQGWYLLLLETSGKFIVVHPKEYKSE